MKPHAFRLGVALLLCINVFLLGGIAQAQDQGALAAAANASMQRMTSNLTAALAAPNEAVAKASVRAGIAAGTEAVATLRELLGVATDDVVRSRTEAALTQTQNAVAKATAALDETGDTFRSTVEAARAEVEEAVEEFAPVLRIVPAPGPTVTSELPRAGEGDLAPLNLVALGTLGLTLVSVGALLRRRFASAA